MSPELCNNQEYSGPAADNWAAGIVLYTILFGVEPFKGKTEQELFRRINSGQINFPESLHPDFGSHDNSYRKERGQDQTSGTKGRERNATPE